MAQQRVREQATWVKEERAASRQAESAIESKKLKDERLSRIKARHARKEAAPESKAARREEKERAARIRGESERANAPTTVRRESRKALPREI